MVKAIGCDQRNIAAMSFAIVVEGLACHHLAENAVYSVVGEVTHHHHATALCDWSVHSAVMLLVAATTITTHDTLLLVSRGPVVCCIYHSPFCS